MWGSQHVYTSCHAGATTECNFGKIHPICTKSQQHRTPTVSKVGDTFISPKFLRNNTLCHTPTSPNTIYTGGVNPPPPRHRLTVCQLRPQGNLG